ncbi:MAG: cyclic nucleotide-binding domain-containing protein [Methylococcales bacterium]|nr:cyclic nucleotide-binding domain-containing protein [Methylococcales bacterium]
MLLTLDPIVVSAFMFGILSAASLPLGAITSMIWKPADRAIAFLMAFGGGALLAALTLDLVAGTVANGHFYSLAAGCIVGGLIFIALNNIINDTGGFLRKVSTTFYHLRKQEYRKFKQIFSMMKRVIVFSHLSDENYKVLASGIHSKTVKKGGIIFNKGDSSDDLYIIASGQVSLLDPTERSDPIQLKKNDDLGWLAFLTGAPYRFAARASEDVSLWVLPKTTFYTLLSNSPILAQEIQASLRKPTISNYLVKYHAMSANTVKLWQDQSVHNVIQRGMFLPALTINHNSQEFRAIANDLIGCDLFKFLPKNEIEAISDHLVYKQFSQGETFYFRGEDAASLFVIDKGHVSMLDALERRSHSYDLSNKYVFGHMSLLTGGNYTMSAMAVEKTSVWVLHKKDFFYLVNVLPELAIQYKAYLQMESIADYLIERQHISHNDTVKWIKNSLRNINNKKAIQPVNSIGFDVSEHKGAPLGIWLGLFLDSIPEALVIGASVAQAGLGFSLLAGLFFSNYPEALSSSVGMKEQGLKRSSILMMWTVLMLSTGLFSALGSIYFAEVSDSVFAFTEGVAAGAMLTMIAQTMLPEAYLKGGEIIGFSSLLGFLAAIFFKTLE